MIDYGITWDDQCLADLLTIFQGNQALIEQAIAAIDWRLHHDPHGQGTWDLGPDKRLTWLRPRQGFPAVAFSFQIENPRPDHYRCVVLRARPANVPSAS